MILDCMVCGKNFKHLGSHIYHRHGITAKEYKTEYELPYNMGLISLEIYQKKSDAFEADREKYVKNLLGNGSKARQFKKGRTGQRRISQHERQVIMERILNVNRIRSSRKVNCPVCRMQFKAVETHLLLVHKLIKVK